MVITIWGTLDSLPREDVRSCVLNALNTYNTTSPDVPLVIIDVLMMFLGRPLVSREEENEEYQVDNEIGELKITYVTFLEEDLANIAKESL